MPESIAFDCCGRGPRPSRLTHMPSGDTLVYQPHMGRAGWDRARLEFLSKYPGLNVHDCARPGPYSTSAPPTGTADAACERLRRKLPPPTPKE